FAPGYSSLQYRWAALTIRKRAKSCRVWSGKLEPSLRRKDFTSFLALPRVKVDPWFGVPGVYLAREKSDNLYVGETLDLGKRFDQHSKAEGWLHLVAGSEISIIELRDVLPKKRWGLQSRFIKEYSPILNYLDLGIGRSAL